MKLLCWFRPHIAMATGWGKSLDDRRDGIDLYFECQCCGKREIVFETAEHLKERWYNSDILYPCPKGWRKGFWL